MSGNNRVGDPGCPSLASRPFCPHRAEQKLSGRTLIPRRRKGEEMKRSIRKYYTLNRKEAEELKKKAKKACRSEAGLVRELVKGYEPREKPGDEFYDAMRDVSSMADQLQRILDHAKGASLDEEQLIHQEIGRWRSFQADIERRFLTPEDGIAKWL